MALINGTSGNDSLVGTDDADTIIGGDGEDTSRGGLGDDVFVYSAVSHASPRDRIMDYASGDKIDLSGIDAIDGGSDDAFGVVSQFSGAAGELVVSSVPGGGAFTIRGDVNGDGQGDFLIRVVGATGPFADSLVL